MSETDHTTLPVHPFTGLTAVGVVAGRPVWPICGGSDDADKQSAAATEAETTPPDAEQKSETDTANDLEKWKALARANEKRAKENADKAKRFDEIEEANRTELEKVQARAEAAEKALAEREAAEAAAQLRDDIAKEKGITGSVLRGATREELEAHADALIAAGIKASEATSDVQGDVGPPIPKDGDLSSSDVVAKALGR